MFTWHLHAVNRYYYISRLGLGNDVSSKIRLTIETEKAAYNGNEDALLKDVWHTDI